MPTSNQIEREIAGVCSEERASLHKGLSPTAAARVRPREELVEVARVTAARMFEGRKRPPGDAAVKKAVSAAFDAIRRRDTLAGTSDHPHAAYSHGVHTLAVEGVEAARRAWEQERAARPVSRSTRRRSGATKAKPALRVAYRLVLTPGELRAVEMARGRYAWADMLATHATEGGLVAFTEPEMWQWCDDVDSDAEGGHSPFPLASGGLQGKLQDFYDERI
jgi:hypothetical protein